MASGVQAHPCADRGMAEAVSKLGLFTAQLPDIPRLHRHVRFVPTSEVGGVNCCEAASSRRTPRQQKITDAQDNAPAPRFPLRSEDRRPRPSPPRSRFVVVQRKSELSSGTGALGGVSGGAAKGQASIGRGSSSSSIVSRASASRQNKEYGSAGIYRQFTLFSYLHRMMWGGT